MSSWTAQSKISYFRLFLPYNIISRTWWHLCYTKISSRPSGQKVGKKMRWKCLKLAHFVTIVQQLVEKLEIFLIVTILWLFDSKWLCRFPCHFLSNIYKLCKFLSISFPSNPIVTFFCQFWQLQYFWPDGTTSYLHIY